MNRIAIALFASGVLLAASYAQAKLPAAPPKSPAEQAAAAAKAKEVAAKNAADLEAAMERAVESYRKKSAPAPKSPAAPASTVGGRERRLRRSLVVRKQ